MKFAVVIERAPSNFAAYVPDLPGCVAIEMHLEGMREDHVPIPEPATRVTEIEVSVS